MTRRVIGVMVGVNPRNFASLVCMKLWELPPSTRMAIGFFVIVPERRIMLCVFKPDMA
jgi:hypothetical protein